MSCRTSASWQHELLHRAATALAAPAIDAGHLFELLRDVGLGIQAAQHNATPDASTDWADAAEVAFWSYHAARLRRLDRALRSRIAPPVGQPLVLDRVPAAMA